MRELERAFDSSPDPSASLERGHGAQKVAVVGAGRAGGLLSRALAASGLEVTGPLGRGTAPTGVDVVLLCVPDDQIGRAATLVPPGPAVGHCSGATTLAPLHLHREAFSLHPLMTIAPGSAPERLHGAGAAVAGSTPRALALAEALAVRLGMCPVALADEDRPAYHAAACIASNFLVTLQAAAERLLDGTGVGREHLLPLVRATVENWAALGPQEALTGPVARGDEATIARQREAVALRAPELLELFDSLVAATRRLASEREAVPA